MSSEADTVPSVSDDSAQMEKEAKSSSSKLNKVVERLKDQSRESSPEPPSPSTNKDSSKVGSSRRKPKVTRKVVDTDDDGTAASNDEDEEEPPFKSYENGINGHEGGAGKKKDDGSGKTDLQEDKKDDDTIDVDQDGNIILPEGTVMVQPEAVDEKKPRFQGPEFNLRRRQKSGEMDVVHCTACNKQINTNLTNSVLKHPVLEVLLCKRCHNWYCSDIITKDSDGDDEQCTWCGDGGNLFICESSHHAFCKGCVQRNLGRAELSKIDEDDNWRCYICDPSPLEKLKKDCVRVMEMVEQAAKKKQLMKEEQKKKEKEKIQKEKEKAKIKTPSGKGGAPKSSKPSPQTASTTHVSQQVVQQLLARNKDKVVMQAKGQPSNLIIVPKGTKPGTVIATPQGKVVLDLASGKNSAPIKPHIQVQQAGVTNLKLDYVITTNNVEQTLDKVLASTESMAMLLRTLKDDLRPAKQPGINAMEANGIKTEVAKKVRRALDAQVRTLNELHHFTKMSAVSRVVPKPKTLLPPRPQPQVRTPTQSIIKAGSQAQPRLQDMPELAGMNIGQVVTPSGLTSAVGNNMIISKETLSSNIQLVTLSDGRVLAVQTVPPGSSKRPAQSPAKPKSQQVPSSAGSDVIELVSSDDEEKISKNDSPPVKKYKPGPKCSKVNKPGPKCSKLNSEVASDSDSSSKKDKFKMRISLGAKSFSGSKIRQDSDDSGKSDSEASQNSDKEISNKTEANAEDKNKEDKEGEKEDDEKETKDKEDNSNDKEDPKKDESDGNGGTKDNNRDSSGDKNPNDSNNDSKNSDGKDNHENNNDKDDQEEEKEEQMELDDDSLTEKQVDGAHNGLRDAVIVISKATQEIAKEALQSGVSTDLKARQSLLHDDSSADEQQNKRDRAARRKAKRKESEAARAALLALDSSSDEDETVSKTKSKNLDKNADLKARDALLKSDGSEENDKGDNDSVMFNVLGNYDAESGEIVKLDSELLEQLDGAGEGLVLKKNGKQQQDDEGEATADSLEESSQSDILTSSGVGKGKSSPRYPSKNSRKAKSKMIASSDSDGDVIAIDEKSNWKEQVEISSEDKNSARSSSEDDSASLKGSDEEFKVSTRRSTRKAISPSKRQKAINEMREKRKKMEMKNRKEQQKSTGDKSRNTKENGEDSCSSSEKTEGEIETVEETNDKVIAKIMEKKFEKQERDRNALLDTDSDGSCDLSSDLSDSEDGEGKNASRKKKSKKDKFSSKLSDSDVDISKKKKKKKIKADTDSDMRMSDNSEKETKKKTKKKDLVSDQSDDSDFEKVKPKRRKRKRKTSSDSSTSEDPKHKTSNKKGKKKRRRIKKMSSSSDGCSEDDGEVRSGEEMVSPDGKKRKKIRKVIKDKKLKIETITAAKAEEERRKRISERQKLYNEVVEVDEKTKQQVTTKCVLELSNDGEHTPLIEVNRKLIRKLKPHQVEAVKFLWDCCCESVARTKEDSGAGCILAHCMGLGKTLSLITFVHTLMRNEELTGVRTCLVVCPLNTVLNWQREWVMWSEQLPDDEIFDVYEMAGAKNNLARTDILETWYENGGLLIIGYEMYRNLAQHKFIKNKKQKRIVDEKLVNPGPDIVVCDEGHILKNSESAISKAMANIRTKRRIVLTGTPLQNNLVEYHCMVDFVKPKLLGTLKEFRNRFVNPMTNGQCADSTPHDVRIMKRRAHILHETLDGCVQRRDYSALAKFLPPKHEYVISIRLTKIQIELYRKYLERSGQGLDGGDVIGKGARLFSDYQNLMKIWTHPWVLKLAEIRDENKKMYDEDSMDSFIDDDEESDVSFVSSDGGGPGASGARGKRATRNSKRSPSRSESDSETDGSGPTRKELRAQINSDSDHEVMKKWKTRSRGGDTSGTHGRDRNEPVAEEEPDLKVSNEWWADYFTEDDKFKVELSGKITMLTEVLKMCESIGDKVLVFSQSLLSLDLIEDFLGHWDDLIKVKAAEENDGQIPLGIQGWTHGLDYFRMDGSTNAQNRKRWSEIFNDEDNLRARLFLISTKAGSLGTNMVGANRVIIFDASWNPSHDVQSIFRVYRFGQTKPCYIYRFLAQGTMEEKIYGRQVSKQSLSARVIDEHQIDRHFTYADLKELYNFQPAEGESVEVPALPKDRLLAELLQTKKDLIYKYHEHDSLLENKVGEELTEEERKAAWEEYEAEKKGIINRTNFGYGNQQGGFTSMIMQMKQQAAMQQMGIPTAQASAMPGMGMGSLMMGGGFGLENICRSILQANPNMSAESLQQHLEQYIRSQYDSSEIMAMHQQQRQIQDQRLLMLQHQQQQRNLMQRQILMTANSGGALASSLLQGVASSSSGTVAAPVIPTGLVRNTAVPASTKESETSASSSLRGLLGK